MKNLLYTFVLTMALASCSSNNTCDYKKVTVLKHVDGVVVDSNTVTDCYQSKADDIGLNEVAGEQTGKQLYVRYYQDGSAVNVRINESFLEYRTRNGDVIFINKVKDNLHIICGQSAKISGSVGLTFHFSK